MKTTDIDALLALTDDFELCNGVFGRFADFNNQIDVDSYSQEERVITLAWHASGLIGNGGFEYLFGGWFAGDPGYVYTAAAFKIIGATESYAAFQRALGVFGDRYPEDPAERDTVYHRVPEEERWAINRQFFEYEQNMTAALARYIRNHRVRFRELLSNDTSKV